MAFLGRRMSDAENVRCCVTDNGIDGIVTPLHLMTNTRMQRDYHEGRLQNLHEPGGSSVIQTS